MASLQIIHICTFSEPCMKIDNVFYFKDIFILANVL